MQRSTFSQKIVIKMSEKPSKIVIDCDPGHDDIWAIYSLIKAEEMFNKVKVLGITICNGNCVVENGSVNTLLLLKTLERLDVR